MKREAQPFAGNRIHRARGIAHQNRASRGTPAAVCAKPSRRRARRCTAGRPEVFAVIPETRATPNPIEGVSRGTAAQPRLHPGSPALRKAGSVYPSTLRRNRSTAKSGSGGENQSGWTRCVRHPIRPHAARSSGFRRLPQSTGRRQGAERSSRCVPHRSRTPSSAARPASISCSRVRLSARPAPDWKGASTAHPRSRKRIPRNANASSPGRRTPNWRKASTPAGGIPSPHALSIGGHAASSTVTSNPFRRIAIAEARPAGPPPTTTTSVRRRSESAPPVTIL